jgi:hypothetical protein
MKKFLLLFILAFSLTSCLKTDVFEKEEEDHFLFSDFYLNELDDFQMDMIEFNSSTFTGPDGFARYRATASFVINPAYLSRLEESFDGVIIINERRYSTASDFVFTQNYGPFTQPQQVNARFELSLVNVREMATATTSISLNVL